MLYLAKRLAIRQIAALVAVVFAVADGAALITAAGVLAETGLRSHMPPGRMVGADVVVSAPQLVHPQGDLAVTLPEQRTIPPEVWDRLAHLPGVRTAVADVSFPAAIIDARGHVVRTPDPSTAGHDWSWTQLQPDLQLRGAAPQGPADIVLDSGVTATAGLHVGDPVRVVAVGHTGWYQLAGTVRSPGAGILFSQETGRALAATNRHSSVGAANLIALRAVPGVFPGALALTVGQALSGSGLTVVTGDARGDALSPRDAAGRSQLVLLAGSLAGIILLVVSFVVAGTLGIAVRAQARDLSLLRAVGAAPRQVRQLVSGEAVVAAMIGGLPGVVLGYLLAAGGKTFLAHLGLFPDLLPLTVGPVPALATIVLLAAAVKVSAVSSGWRMSRAPASEAVAGSGTEMVAPSPRRERLGLLLIVAAATLSAVPLLVRSPLGAASTPIVGLVLALGLAIAGPSLLHRGRAILVRRWTDRRTAPTWLALHSVLGQPTRMAAMISAPAMALLFVLTYALTQTTVMAATARDVTEGTLAQQSISAPALGGIPEDVLPLLHTMMGVITTVSVSQTTIVWAQKTLGDTSVESYPALVLTPQAAGVLALDVRAGTLAGLHGNAIAVGQDLAGSDAHAVGRQVKLTLGDGTQVETKIVAVYARSLGFGSIALSADLASGHISTTLSQHILIRTNGSSAAHDELAALVAAHPGLTLEATTPEAAQYVPPEVALNFAVVGVLVLYLLLAIGNKLFATVRQRRDEFTTLRLLGMTRRQIRTMMRREAATISFIAVGAGIVLAALPLGLLGLGFLSRPWPAGPSWLLPAAALTITVTILTTVELATRHAYTSKAR